MNNTKTTLTIVAIFMAATLVVGTFATVAATQQSAFAAAIGSKNIRHNRILLWITLFIVKKLNKSGNWDSISLIDENGSFRGEARFESKSDAEAYLKLYKERMNKKLMVHGKTKSKGSYKIFELDSKTMAEQKKQKYRYANNLSPLS